MYFPFVASLYVEFLNECWASYFHLKVISYITVTLSLNCNAILLHYI